MKKDGWFQIFYRDGFAHLAVYPPGAGGRPVYYEDILGKLNLLDIPAIRKQTVFEIIDEAAGSPRKLAEWPDGDRLGPVIEILLSDDRMVAEMIVHPEKPGGEPLSLEMLEKNLSDQGIVFGLLRENMEELVTRRMFGMKIIAARGLPPVNQLPARVEYLFNTERGKPFLELEYDRIDLRELDFIQNCHSGDELARLLDTVPPADGKDVMGNQIPAETGGEAPQFRAGPGALLSENGKTILAAIDGNVKLHKSVVTVEPVITVADVDYSNGNMDFNGTLDIQGRIADGFSVKADGDIQIGKSVSRVHISSGGDMLLKAGISGNDGGELICRGDLYARYIENARIICRGNLFVEEAIMHSRVKVEKDIILTGKRAEIFGGKIIAGGSIRCKKLGSVNEPPTELHLGVGLGEFARLEELESAMAGDKKELDELDTRLRQLKNAAAAEQGASPLLEKLMQASHQLEEKSSELNQAISRNLRELHDLKRDMSLNEDSRLSVEQWIFGQVFVYFGPHRWHSTGQGTSRTVLTVKQGKLLEKGQ